MNWITIAIYVVVGLSSFMAGWLTSNWKNDAEDKPVLVQEIVDQRRHIEALQRDLQSVIDKASETANSVNNRMAAIDGVLVQRNQGLELLARRTRELGDEISKIDPIGCDFTPPYRSMWRVIGEEANSDRDRLYAPAN